MRHKNKFLAWVMAGVVIMGLTGCAAAEENEIIPQDNSGYENSESETVAISETAPVVVTTETADITTTATTTTEQTTATPTTDYFGELNHKGMTFYGTHKEDEFMIYAGQLGNGYRSLEISACELALAFLAADFEVISSFYEDEKEAKKQVDFMKMYMDSYKNWLSKLKYIGINSISYNKKIDDGIFVVNFMITREMIAHTYDYPNGIEKKTSDLIMIKMYLNDEGEWKTHYIDYN